MMRIIFITFVLCIVVVCCKGNESLPVVINTWGNVVRRATEKAWSIVSQGGSSLDAVELGCNACEIQLCSSTIGYGGSPDESGETTLDAMIMDGVQHKVGSVGALKRIKEAIRVARSVMEYTQHTLIVGDDATQFAVEMGFTQTNLSTNFSIHQWEAWKAANCQPNYWQDVTPNSASSCGPYKPHLPQSSGLRQKPRDMTQYITEDNHDTLGMAVVDAKGNIAAGTTTNGASHKIDGRVGDSPIAGAGAYASNVGAAAATGDGDIMMRFLPTYQTVENMRRGMHPQHAAEDAIARIREYYPNYHGGIVAVNRKGEYGGACNGWTFQYNVISPKTGNITVVTVNPKL